MTDVGVLLVHGIGTSRPGDTLVDWGDTLSKALGATNDTSSVVLHEVPAYLDVVLQNKRVRIMESAWGELFRAPSYWSFLGWSLLAVPTILVSHFDERYRRAAHAAMERIVMYLGAWTALPSELKSVGGARGAWRALADARREGEHEILAFLLELVILFMGLIGAPLLLAALFLVFLFSFLPGVRDFVEPLKEALIGYVGDSQVLSADRLPSRGIVSKVRSDIENLQRLHGRCIVVAHSQGAAISHAAIRSLPRAQRPATFVSFGSGLRKIGELRTYTRDGRAIVYAYLASFSAAGSMCAIADGARSTGQSALEAASAILGYSLLVNVFGLGVRMALQGLHEWLRRKSVSGTPGENRENVIRSVWNWIGLAAIAALTWWGPRPLSGLQTPGWYQLAPVLMGVSFTFLMHWRYKVGRKTSQTDQLEHEEREWRRYQLDGVEWIDIYATSDPVSNGPTVDLHVPEGYYPRPAVNELAALMDHTSYFKNEGFVQLLVAEIERDTPNHGAASGRPKQRPVLHGSTIADASFRMTETFGMIGFASAILHIQMYGLITSVLAPVAARLEGYGFVDRAFAWLVPPGSFVLVVVGAWWLIDWGIREVFRKWLVSGLQEAGADVVVAKKKAHVAVAPVPTAAE